MAAMVEVARLAKRFGAVVAVDDISFEVDRGEVLGFLGPNGAGKSTTMKMISGFLAPDAGEVRIGGENCVEHPVATKKRIGYLPEGAPLYGDMPVHLFLRFIGEIRGFRGRDLEQKIKEVVDKVNLGGVIEQSIDTLSKGFKRRVGIAQAILHDPDILILDEPTDGLDPNQKHEMRHLIRQMSRQKAIILSTHILEEVDAVCTRAIIVARGKIVADGKPAELEAQSTRHNAVTLTVRESPADGIVNELSALDGVERVEFREGNEGLSVFMVKPVSGSQIIEQVSATARRQGWMVEGLHVEQGRLDDVFRQVTEVQQS